MFSSELGKIWVFRYMFSAGIIKICDLDNIFNAFRGMFSAELVKLWVWVESAGEFLNFYMGGGPLYPHQL